MPTIASREEVEATKNHVLETFYPISPVIDLHESNVYDVKDDTGEDQCLGLLGSVGEKDMLFLEEKDILRTC